MKINSQTIYIILIILFFNFLLLNIFRLQDDIKNVLKNNIPGFNKNKNKYKSLNNNNNNSEISKKLNEIASIVPIDFNKIDNTNAKFIPKYKQI
jgi:hypothetical protein